MPARNGARESVDGSPRTRFPAQLPDARNLDQEMLRSTGDPLRRLSQRVVGKMGVPGGRLCVGVTRDPPHHRQTLASHHRLQANRCRRSWNRTSSSLAALQTRRH